MRHLHVSTIVSILMLACSGSAGPAGQNGDQGPQGPQGPAGPAGEAGTTPAVIDLVGSLQLPIIDGQQPAFYTTGLAAAADGTLFVSSLTGELVKFTPDSIDPVVIVPAANGPGLIANVLVDDGTSTLWACGNTFQNPATFEGPSATLIAYDFSGNKQKSYPFPGPQPGSSLCEDIAVDAKHDVYVTDPFTGSVFVLASGASSLVSFTTNAALAPNSKSAAPNTPPFGAHGITYDGTGNLYVSNFYNSTLSRIPINADGSAGTLVAETVTPFYGNPETLHMLDSTHMLGVLDTWSKGGDLVKLTLTSPDTWTVAVLKNNLAGPTGAVVSHGSYWVTEGQVSQIVDFLLFSGPPPNPTYPFVIDRVDAL